MKRKGLSLLEILISTILLALVVAVLGNVFVATKRLTLHLRSQVTASEIGRRFLEPLQVQVRQDQWGNNCLSSDLNPNTFCSAFPCTAWTDASSNTTYTPTCVTNTHPQLSTIRKAVVTVQWQERIAQ